ncbi:MAG: hypothetical protein KGV50_04090 [Gammaproteobacteria bacterium]|nr:hypothetical protein [Gammaproteobacteria bacterium]
MKSLILNRYLCIAVALCAAAFFPAQTKQSLVIKGQNELPPPQLGISPPRFEHTIVASDGKRIDESLVLYNYNDKPKKIRLTLFDVNKNKRPIKPSKNTLSPWTIINPKEFTIPANSEQTIRLSIRPPVSFVKKTHYAMLKIDNYVDNAFKVDDKNQSVIVTLGASYGLPIVVRVQ